ncbi:MAG: hypothetical protein GY953_54060, partial [bacterium]|nr:hypothetical protein [bacterium]
DEAEFTTPSAADQSPEAAFSATWTVMLIRQVLEAVRTECEQDGLDSHWVVFDRRVVRPMLVGGEPEPYASLVERLDLEGAAQASNMLITIKRRFARALLTEVGRTVDEPGQAEDELCELLRELEAPA